MRWLTLAIDLAVRNVADGGGPFGAVVVREGELVATGVNRVTADLDPTAHAEVAAIRAACRATGDFALHGAELYSSCEPCPLCLATVLWARVARVEYAAGRADAAAAGFDDAVFHGMLAAEPGAWTGRLAHAPHPRSAEPFAAWLEHGGRQSY